MTNYEIADIFSLLSKLSDIHGVDAFKVKQYSIAAYNIEKISEAIADMEAKTLHNYKGIGASTGKKIEEILQTGQLQALTELIEKTPSGIFEMMQIKGLGPKKIVTIWKELEVETIGELLYACNENRLLLYKGFGEKNQKSIKESIEFYLNNQGSFLYAHIEPIEPQIRALLNQLFDPSSVRLTGDYRMYREIIEALEYVIHYPKNMLMDKIAADSRWHFFEEKERSVVYKLENSPLKICLYYCADAATGFDSFRDQTLFLTSGTKDFCEAFATAFPNVEYRGSDTEEDEVIFAQAEIQYIPAFLRESAAIISLAQQHKIPKLIETSDIKGIIHNHSNWSDGNNTIEEMAEDCIANGFEYLVISDHSKSAFYANGLTEERIKAQHQYIDSLNDKYAPFKIFKSIECDILNDGSLDYSDSILSTFDMVIASVHSNLKMTEEKAMQRLLAAIENPYTTILGHLTGRLLLSRPPYPVDYKTIIDACAEHQVVIELNAHPSRLDIDWRHIAYALQKDVLISIDPDAHSLEGFKDIKYGVIAAQKAMVQAQQNLSSFSLRELEEFLFETKEMKFR
jgi:DNA polymerase (family X)